MKLIAKLIADSKFVLVYQYSILDSWQIWNDRNAYSSPKVYNFGLRFVWRAMMIEIVNFPTCSWEFPNCFDGSFVLIKKRRKKNTFFKKIFRFFYYSNEIYKFVSFENDRIFSNSKIKILLFTVQFYWFFFLNCLW